MKAVLLLCLLAFISCEKDIIDIGKCIYKAPKVQEFISDVIVAIATKDYSKLLPKIKEALPELIKVVLGCLTETKAVEDEAKLDKPQFYCPKEEKTKCFNKCNGAGNRCYSQCIRECGGLLSNQN